MCVAPPLFMIWRREPPSGMARMTPFVKYGFAQKLGLAEKTMEVPGWNASTLYGPKVAVLVFSQLLPHGSLSVACFLISTESRMPMLYQRRGEIARAVAPVMWRLNVFASTISIGDFMSMLPTAISERATASLAMIRSNVHFTSAEVTVLPAGLFASRRWNCQEPLGSFLYVSARKGSMPYGPCSAFASAGIVFQRSSGADHTGPMSELWRPS